MLQVPGFQEKQMSELVRHELCECWDWNKLENSPCLNGGGWAKPETFIIQGFSHLE